MPCSICRDTPKALAAPVTDRPTDGRMSSLIISPGCIAGNAFFLFIAPSLKVVFIVYVPGQKLMPKD
jgi:hypothetical protein